MKQDPQPQTPSQEPPAPQTPVAAGTIDWTVRPEAPRFELPPMPQRDWQYDSNAPMIPSGQPRFDVNPHDDFVQWHNANEDDLRERGYNLLDAIRGRGSFSGEGLLQSIGKFLIGNEVEDMLSTREDPFERMDRHRRGEHDGMPPIRRDGWERR